MINSMDLGEMFTRGGSFTWSNGVIGTRRSNSKIDRVFTNELWLCCWSKMFCELYEGGSSKHLGMLERLQLIDRPRKPSHLINSTLGVEGLPNLWSSATMFKLQCLIPRSSERQCLNLILN